MYECVNNNCTGKLEIGLNTNDRRSREVIDRMQRREKERAGIDYGPFEGLWKDVKSRKISDPFWSLYTEIQDGLSQFNFLGALWKKSSDKNCPCLYACPYRVKLFMKKESQDTGSLFYEAFLCIFIFKPLKRTRLNFTFTAPSFYCSSSLRFLFPILIFKRFWLFDDTSHFAVIRSLIHEITSIV